jgi:serine O-acetyltransferase
VRDELRNLRDHLIHFVTHVDRPYGEADASRLADAFVAGLREVQDALRLDAQATCEADPATSSVDEVILAYPGFYALACHRLAHDLFLRGVPLLPRLITETAHRVTGIDIHPGARLGHGIAIDHGTGIVIGETSVIGDRVRLYQGVTLGALSVRKELARTRRHPTIEHDVVIYANATILGGDTVVGHSSVIGGNVWLTHSVPPHSVITNVASSERHTPDSEEAVDVKV